jgi:uncharacterized membrane protein
MSPLTVVIAAFAIALVVMSFAFSGGAVIIALPVAFVAIAVATFLDVRRRREQARSIHDHREQAKTESVEFTERDQRTLVSE